MQVNFIHTFNGKEYIFDIIKNGMNIDVYVIFDGNIYASKKINLDENISEKHPNYIEHEDDKIIFGYKNLYKLKCIKTTKVNTYDNTNCLLSASLNKDLKNVYRLLKSGINPNLQDDYGHTPLMLACLDWRVLGYHNSNVYKVVELLLKNDANPNLQDKYGLTALMNASVSGNVDVIKLLLQFGANIDTISVYGETAIQIAKENGYIDIEKLLNI